jgi:hypothetical protein
VIVDRAQPDEEARDMPGKQEDAEWLERRREIVEAVESGLITGKEAMAELGITAGTLGGWCRAEQVRRAKGDAPRVAPERGRGFARVSLVGGRRGAVVAVIGVRGGRRIAVHAGFDDGEVRRLVRLLETC